MGGRDGHLMRKWLAYSALVSGLVAPVAETMIDADLPTMALKEINEVPIDRPPRELNNILSNSPLFFKQLIAE
jgi:hypothetical protein